MSWIADHSSMLNVVINAGMFCVWVAYLQLFLMTYLRQRKPRLLINRGSGTDLDFFCLVSNMSQEPVYAQTVYCTIRTEDDAYSTTVTDREILQGESDGDRPAGATRQGPLDQGDFMTIGTFGTMLRVTVDRSDGCPSEPEELAQSIRSIEVMVIAAFGGDDLEIAARRSFRIDPSTEPWGVIPHGPQTRQVSSRRERKRIRRMIVEELQSR